VLAPRVLDLNAIVNEMGKMLPRLIGEDIEYSFAAEPALVPVLADPGQVEQVILNLAVNARDAMPNGGKLLVRTANITIDGAEAAQHPPMTAGKYVRLSVEDTGHGMDDETKARIFEPFFTTKEVGKGTGLGLATVYGIVKQSGGFIWLESKPGQGARFEIYLPQTTKSCAPSAEERSMPDFAGGSETILVVEDEAGVRELTCEFLNSGGYRVLQAHDGADAMEVAARYHGTIALLLTDVVMPRMGGRALAQRLRIGCPAMKVLFMSGYAEYSETPRDLPANAPRVLQKPFSRQQLLENVRTVLSESASESIAHARIGVTRIEGKP
jgi:two-component system cell cycle sensor histidine kinase/response regulator CckA